MSRSFNRQLSAHRFKFHWRGYFADSHFISTAISSTRVIHRQPFNRVQSTKPIRRQGHFVDRQLFDWHFIEKVPFHRKGPISSKRPFHQKGHFIESHFIEKVISSKRSHFIKKVISSTMAGSSDKDFAEAVKESLGERGVLDRLSAEIRSHVFQILKGEESERKRNDGG